MDRIWLIHESPGWKPDWLGDIKLFSVKFIHVIIQYSFKYFSRNRKQRLFKFWMKSVNKSQQKKTLEKCQFYRCLSYRLGTCKYWVATLISLSIKIYLNVKIYLNIKIPLNIKISLNVQNPLNIKIDFCTSWATIKANTFLHIFMITLVILFPKWSSCKKVS